MSENYQFILYDVADGIASITLNRPPVNVIDETMTLEYFDALTRADGDDAVKVIVLSGKGKGLSAGVDIRYLEEFGTEEMARFLEMFYVEQVERVRGRSKPIIATVQGFAREGACTMAFTCDMVIAADDASFGYPGVPHLAAPPGMHVWHLQRLLGRMRATELILTGDRIDAATALQAGIVSRVVPPEELMDTAMELAGKIAANAPLAVRAVKEVALTAMNESFEQGMRFGGAMRWVVGQTDDAKEGPRAFAEKREAVFKGH